MAFVFVGSACIPCSSMTVPRNFTEVLKNWHFSTLSVMPASCRQCSVAVSHLSCSSWSAPWTRMSSIWHITPSTSIRISDIVSWKISGAELMPKGRQSKQHRPKGVTNVVSSFDSSSRGSCQNPLLVQSLVN